MFTDRRSASAFALREMLAIRLSRAKALQSNAFSTCIRNGLNA